MQELKKIASAAAHAPKWRIKSHVGQIGWKALLAQWTAPGTVQNDHWDLTARVRPLKQQTFIAG